MQIGRKNKTKEILDKLTLVVLSAFIFYVFCLQHVISGLGFLYVGLGAAMFLLFCVQFKSDLSFYQNVFFVVLFLLVCLISALFSSATGDCLYWVSQCAQYVIPVLLIYNYVGTDKAKLRNVMVVISVTVFVLCVALLIFGKPNHNNVLVLSNLNPNAFSNFLLLATIANLWICTTSKSKKTRLFIALIILFEFVVQVLLASRRGMVIVLFVIGSYMFVLLITKYQNNLYLWALAIASVFVLGLVVLLNFELIAEKVPVLQKFTNELGKHSNETRQEYHTAAMKLFKENPIIGKGLGAVSRKIGMYSHSLYYEVLACLGVVGAAVLLCPLFINTVRCFVASKRTKSLEDNILLKTMACHIIALLASGIAVVYIYEISLYIEIALICAACHIFTTQRVSSGALSEKSKYAEANDCQLRKV